jgi:hypothetical protein
VILRKKNKNQSSQRAHAVIANMRDDALRVARSQPRKHKNKGLLSSLGGTIGNAISPGGGGIVGSAAGEVLGNLFGWGDYAGTAPVGFNVNSNSAMGFVTPLAAQIPMMHTEDGCCRIKKREYIADIRMFEEFTIEVFALNPISERTFPWLSQVARNFEQFKFLGLAFGFRSLTANALGSTGDPSMGSISILTQYDVYDLPVSNKVEANNALFATSCKPSENMLHPIECDPEQTPNNPLYTAVNENPFAPDNDKRLDNLGYTTVAVQGGPKIGPDLGYLSGELWITYDVMLYKPMVNLQQPISEISHVTLADLSLGKTKVSLEQKADAACDFDYVQRPKPLDVQNTPRR